MRNLFLAVLGLAIMSGSTYTAHSDHHHLYGEKLCDGFLPENDLHLEDNLFLDGSINEELFNEIITHVQSFYEPIVESHGATLSMQRNWSSSTVNAFASREGDTWTVAMFGGLARRKEVTPDGFALVVCHEFGHHVAGFPFKGERWASSEGQSDYFATQACGRMIWKDQHEENARFEATVDPVAKASCDSSWEDQKDRHLCYRIAMGGYSLADLLSSLNNQGEIAFDTPDPRQVSRSQESHPRGQCRLDTYYQGALCTKSFNDAVIPGRSHPSGQGSLEAEAAILDTSCTTAAFDQVGTRPRCWFKDELQIIAMVSDFSYKEVIGNNNEVIDPGETVAYTATLENLTSTEVDGLWIQASSESSNISISNDYYELPKIGPDGTVKMSEPFLVEISNDAECGSKIPLDLKLGKNDSELTLPKFIEIGGRSLTPPAENNEVTPIPNWNTDGLNSLIAISESMEAVRKIKVSVDITHSFIGELKVSLIAPGGQVFVLHDREGGGDDNIVKTYEVEGLGINTEGEWKLFVQDVWGFSSGELNSWSLQFETLKCSAI